MVANFEEKLDEYAHLLFLQAGGGNIRRAEKYNLHASASLSPKSSSSSSWVG